MNRLIKFTLTKDIKATFLDFIFLAILTVAFFWKVLFVDSALSEFFSCGFIFYFLMSVFLMYLFMMAVIKVSRFSAFITALIFTFSGALLGKVLLNPEISRRGWLLGIYIGILPLCLLRLAFLEKYKKLSRIFLGIFLISLISFLKIKILTHFNLLASFSLAVLVGLGIENLFLLSDKKSMQIYELYLKRLKKILFFISFIVLPIIFGLLLRFYGSGLENTSINISGGILLTYIFFALSVLILNLKLSKDNTYLPRLVIILIILDVFSYWGMFK